MTQFINPFSVLRHFNMIVRDSGGNGNNGGNNDNDSGSSDPGSGTGDDGWGDWDDTADWGQDDSYDYGYDDNDNDNNDYYYDEPLTPIAPPSTPAPYEPPGYDFGGGNDNDTTSPTDESNVYDFYNPDPVTYPAPPPDPILPDDRGYPDVYDPTPFEGPATDDDLGLTDAPISDYYNTEDPYEPNLLDPQTDDDLGFEDTLDTTDIFGPDADLIQDPVTGYVRPMTTQEIEQGAFDTRLSYAAPDNVLNQDIGDLSSATFDTGATITGTSPTDTANAYNFDNIAGVDPTLTRQTLTLVVLILVLMLTRLRLLGLRAALICLVIQLTWERYPQQIYLMFMTFTMNQIQSLAQIRWKLIKPHLTLALGLQMPPALALRLIVLLLKTKALRQAVITLLEDASDYNQSFDPTGLDSGVDSVYDPNIMDAQTDDDLGLGDVPSAFPSNNTVYDDSKKPLKIELTKPMDTGEETKITTNASGAKVYSNGMTEAEMRALYGQYGTTPNDTESKIMRNIMATERHAEDGPIDPKTGKPIYNSGDLVFDERGIDKFNSAANDVTGFFLQGISNGIFGRNFSKNQAKNLADKNKKALEALQKTGKYAYSADGKTAIGVVDTDGTVIKLRMDPSVVEENDSDPYPVCEPGYILVNGVCVPDDSLGTGDGGGGSGTEGRYGGTFGGPIIRPTTPRTPRTPVVTPPTLPAPTIRAPKQFAMGGEVSPGLITAADRFLASLKG
jgi:hypothetical protein